MLNFGRSKNAGCQSLSQYLTMGELNKVFIAIDYPTSFSEVFLSSLQAAVAGAFKARSSVHMNYTTSVFPQQQFQRH